MAYTALIQPKFRQSPYRHKREYTSKSGTNTQERLGTSKAWVASGGLQHNEYKQDTAENKSRQQAVIKSWLLQA
eukprot:5692223-Pleurochrysis_carterae.AAC.1